MATVFYASAIAFERLAGCAPAWGSGAPTFTIHIATLAVALAGVAFPSRPFAILAEELLPEALYNTVGPSGVLSGECGRLQAPVEWGHIECVPAGAGPCMGSVWECNCVALC